MLNIWWWLWWWRWYTTRTGKGSKWIHFWGKSTQFSVNEIDITRYFIPVTKEKSTCDISSATIGTLFLCCVRVLTKIQERCCCLCFVILTQRDMCKSRTLQHIHNMRREKRKKNGKIGESSKVERMATRLCQIYKVKKSEEVFNNQVSLKKVLKNSKLFYKIIF